MALRLLGIDLKGEAQKLKSTLGGTGTKLAPGQFEAFGALRANLLSSSKRLAK